MPHRATPALRRATLVAGLSLLAPAVHAQSARPAAGSGANSTVLVLDSIDLTAVSTLAELLQARVPGLVVRSQSGSAGAGARVSARGVRSVYAFGDPLLLVDGRRAVGTQRDFGVDDAVTTSRLDDLVLEQLERVEVLLGPAAAARYGPGAANGAILVTTRRGTAGRPRARAYAQGGGARDLASYPLFHKSGGRDANGGAVASCTREWQADGQCAPQAIQSLDLYAARPSRSAGAAAAGVTIDGGAGQSLYWAGLDARGTQGVLSGNEATRLGVRANLTLQPSEAVRLELRAAGMRSTAALLPGDQRTLVDLGDLLGPGARHTLRSDAAGQHALRADLGVRAEWSARPGLRLWLDGGLSDVSRRDSLTGPESDPFTAPGARTEHRSDAHDWIADGELGLQGSYGSGALRLSSTAAAIRLGARRTQRSGVRLGAGTLSAERWSQRSVDQWALRAAQQLRVADRLTIDLDGRWNRSPERFGAGDADVDASAAAAWTALRSVSGRSLVVRGAFGTSALPFSATLGQAPLATRPICFFTCPAAAVDEPAPERTREWEGGIELRGVRRGGLRLTGFHQRTDAVAVQTLAAPSLGFPGATSLAFTDVRNAGVEATLDVAPLRRANAGLDVVLSGALLRNRLGALPVREGVIDQDRRSSFPSGQVLRTGAALGAFTRRPFTVRDADADGIVTRAEVTEGSTGSEIRGAATPTRTASLDARLRLGRRTVVGALTEYRGGHLAYGSRPALYANADAAAFFPGASAEAQARTVSSAAKHDALVDRADFTRLRELSVAYTLGTRARGPVLTLAGRNLLTWTGFHGIDPETSAAPNSPLLSGGFFVQPLPASLTVRLSSSF